jgi:uncharacterized RDD family membrane protein YckC
MSSGYALAGRWRRLFATLLDCIFVPTATIFLVMIFGVVEDAEDYADNWWILWVLILAVVGYLILNGYTLWRRGQTFGKMMVGIAIVSASGSTSGNTNDLYGFSPAPLWKLICLRALFFPLLFVIALPPIGLLPIVDQLLIFTKHRRCLHDLVSGTVVIRLPATT